MLACSPNHLRLSSGGAGEPRGEPIVSEPAASRLRDLGFRGDCKELPLCPVALSAFEVRDGDDLDLVVGDFAIG
jgi:hypothetical protein